MKPRPILSAPWDHRKPATPRLGSDIDPEIRALVKGRASGKCELCDAGLGVRWECHHRKLKSQGGQDSAANLVALCFLCHRRCHGHRVWAEENGWIVPSYEDPAKTPVAIRDKDWRFLTISGTYLPAGDAA